MGNVNTIPVVSQTKSLVQLATGDKDGAAETQEKFLHECIGVSQVTSAVYLLAGETEKAGETQIRCGKTLSNFADGVPVVGHVKGAIHHAVGDHEGGNKALVAATRTTGVMAGGAAGFLIGGPVGAVAGGIASGGALDGAATLGASLREKEYKPEGIFASVQEVIDNPSGGAVFDAVAGPVFDGLAGYQGGKIAGAIENAAAARAANAPIDPKNAAKAAEVRVYADKAMAIAEEMRETPGVTSGELMKQYDVAMALDKKATLIEKAGRPTPSGFNPKATKSPNVYPPGVTEQDSNGKKFKTNTECTQQASTSHSSRERTTTKTETFNTNSSSSIRCYTSDKLLNETKFYQELRQVVHAFKKFDFNHEYDLSFIEAKIERFLKGKGAPVVQTVKMFTKTMLNESETQNFKTEQVVSVLYGKTTAEKFDKKNPLKGFQVLLRHQSETMGALHILLSHPQDMLDILPGLDISLFPPHIRSFLENDLKNLKNGTQRRRLTEDQKLAIVQEAKQYYAKCPSDKRKMMANELLLVAYLRLHMNPLNFYAHQFYPVPPIRQQFRVIFNVPTTTNQIRQLAICLSCDQGGSGKAIIYKSPGKDGVDCDCYEIITSFLI
uniref:EF-hand domain-containing protein n=1 Tax=Caenorhabditis tropicalis TaxID=1561998 RepID=A0A1I7T3A4_9PELO